MAQKASAKKPTKKTPPKKGASARVAAKKADAPKPKSAPVKKPEAKATPAPAKRGPAPAPARTSPVAVKETKPEPKPEKVQKLSKSDLQYYKNLLIERRREIVGDMGSMESEAFKGGSNLSNMPIHMADVGTDNFEQEFTLGLIESERVMLREIQEALIRIEDGSYGICMGTGKSIPKVRLEAVPWAKYTMEYSRLLEQGKIGRDNGQSSDDDTSDDDDD